MLLRDHQALQAQALDWLDRRWKLVVFLLWLCFSCWFILQRWADIEQFRLSDTDDNMRMLQVRAWLDGQGWYDLRQYRFDPPGGANIHWSRVVDLPIGGLILLLRPMIGPVQAERLAVGVEPLLPYLLLLFAVAATARWLVDRRAWPLAILALLFATRTNLMFMPERIDHHGWQLALLALGVAALADPHRRRGGILLGISTALSVAIGLEMVVFLAILGLATVLIWVTNPDDDADRMKSYALTLSGAMSLAFLAFASYDNRVPRCDALTPVWLSDALVAGALMYALAWVSPASWERRLAAAFAAGGLILSFHAIAWPHCLHSLQNIDPNVRRLWLSRESRPITDFPKRYLFQTLALPAAGMIGWVLLAWTRRNDRGRLGPILAAAAVALCASLLLLWENRTGPAAQSSAVVGAAAFVWILAPLAWSLGSGVARTIGVLLVLVVGTGAAVPLAFAVLLTSESAGLQMASGPCESLNDLQPVGMQPQGVVLTLMNLAPRLVAISHHDAIAGPYHRNGQQIADVMNAMSGDPEQAHRIVGKYRASYVLICAGQTGRSTILSIGPNGFYAQLERGEVPAWLARVPLPAGSPFEMWKVVG